MLRFSFANSCSHFLNTLRNNRTSGLKRFLAILIWLSATHVFIRLVTTTNYLVNDDFKMAELMNGNITGKFESNVIFMHPIVGNVVSTLNSVSLSIPWFPLLLIFIQILAFSSLASLNLNRVNYLFLLFFSTAHIAFSTVVPSFTPAAIVVASCGLALFIHSIIENSQRFAWIGVLLIILGGLIRFDGMVFALLMFAVTVALVTINKNNPKSMQLRLFAPVLFLIAGITFISQTPSICKTQSECGAWATYNSFNAIRGDFAGTSRMNLIENELGNTSWSMNDFQLFKNFLYIDDETFNLKNLEQIDDVVPNPSIGQALFSNPIAPMWKVASLNKDLSLFFYPVFAVFVFLSLRERKRDHSGKLFLAFGLVGWLIATAAAATIRFPMRIHEPAIIALAILLLTWSSSTAENSVPFRARHDLKNARRDLKNARRDLKLFFSLLLVLVWFLISYLTPYSARNQSRLSAQNANYVYLEKNFSNARFIVSPGLLTYVDPWSNPTSDLSRKLLYLGWATSSPHFKAKKETLDIDNVYRELVENESTLLIGPRKNAILIAEYLNEHFGIAALPILVGESPSPRGLDLQVWAFKKSN
jgi:hypothetical protein